ncbi:MAG TPA: Rrf2 family transcriptional regulator [Bacillota bacterium]|nr:Rrf2 family transcriptional regulator [Bacillota bacterium]
MKITTKGRYGLTIMIELTRNYGKRHVPLKEIAEKHQLSLHYLEQLATSLRNNGLIKSVRGAGGGYLLTKEPNKIIVGDIITALEGPILFVEEMSNEEPAQKALWNKLRNAVKDILDTTTLEDLLAMHQEDKQENYMFYI